MVLSWFRVEMEACVVEHRELKFKCLDHQFVLKTVRMAAVLSCLWEEHALEDCYIYEQSLFPCA